MFWSEKRRNGSDLSGKIFDLITNDTMKVDVGRESKREKVFREGLVLA